jgi:hypothetical protein
MLRPPRCFLARTCHTVWRVTAGLAAEASSARSPAFLRLAMRDLPSVPLTQANVKRQNRNGYRIRPRADPGYRPRQFNALTRRRFLKARQLHYKDSIASAVAVVAALGDNDFLRSW